jgi:hypothetical protein
MGVPEGPKRSGPVRGTPTSAESSQPSHPAKEKSVSSVSPPVSSALFGRDLSRHQDESPAEASFGLDRIGDPTVDAEAIRQMGSLIAARHLMALLARKTREGDRKSVIEEVGALLLGLEDAQLARRLLFTMSEVGRIVDVYPLEVLVHLLEKAPEFLSGLSFGSVVLNKKELESRSFEAGELIVLKVPLALRMRGFAISGGGSPGYVLVPGPPAEYHLEVHTAGRFALLLRGEIRKAGVVDGVQIQVV